MVCEITRCQLYAHESKIGQLGAVDAAWSGRLSRLQARPYRMPQLPGGEGSPHGHHACFTCGASRHRLIEPDMPSAIRGSGGDLR